MSNSDASQDSNLLRRRPLPAAASGVSARMEPRLLNIGFGSNVVAMQVNFYETVMDYNFGVVLFEAFMIIDSFDHLFFNLSHVIHLLVFVSVGV